MILIKCPFIHLIIIIIIPLIFQFNHTIASCLYMKLAYENGKRISNLMENHGKYLREQGYIVKDGHPADTFFQESPLDKQTAELYKKSTQLLYVQQEFLKSYFTRSHPHQMRLISNEQKLQSLQYFSECLTPFDKCRHLNVTTCDVNFKYRNLQGFCNSLKYPNRGVAYTAFNTILPAACFDDGIYTIRKSFKTKSTLPEPRTLSNALIKAKSSSSLFSSSATSKESKLINFFALMFGQYIAHDLALRNLIQPDEGGSAIQCCTNDYRNVLSKNLQHPGCAPLSISNVDPFYSAFNVTCQNFIRSQTILSNNCNLGATKQVNIASHFLDNSNIYGNTEKIPINIRTYKFGQLKVNQNNVLPFIDNYDNDDCYFTGDLRVNQTPMLALIHSIFLRLHNVIAKQLLFEHKHWTDDHLFYETKRICIALYQHIVYEEWLPLLLGEQYCKNRNLIRKSTDEIFQGKYNENIDPSILNEFSHGAFRLFHSYLPSVVHLFGKDEKLMKSFNLSDIINKPKHILENNYDDLVRGMLFSEINFKSYSDELRNKLFKDDNQMGIDLLSFDIQRGRDHGICPYHKYYELCTINNKKIIHWNDLSQDFSKENIELLMDVYESVYDIDLFVGIALEQKSNANYLGTVGRCIIGTQFFYTKFGDRFFYTFSDGFSIAFTKEQLIEIKKFNFAKLLCMVTSLEKIPFQAFVMPYDTNNKLKCTDIEQFNISLWN